MKRISYEEYVTHASYRLGNPLYWYTHKLSFIKPYIRYRYTFILFRRYMDHDIRINWDTER